MPRTPDSFPGERIEESILFTSESNALPSAVGEERFVSSSVSGSGLFFLDVDGLKKPTALPTQVGQVLFAINSGTFIAALPVTATGGWLLNNQGILLVNTGSS